ncbi:MAG: menaquinone biosynthesis protein [Bacteroidales bacterium]|nr:menaquinone biosynthesis protein [Bacteroidales bacterium]
MNKIKVSAVSYLNTVPFVYGLKNSGIINKIELSLDIPSVCAEKLISDKVDIGLIPVAAIPQIKNYKIIADYCIGAIGRVKSVILASNIALDKIDTIYLDYQSRTSVNLVKVLAKHYWKKDVEWKNTEPGFETSVIKGNSAAVIIGDRTFAAVKQYIYIYDLAEEWYNFTHKPFVFAAWVANKDIPGDFEREFNKALRYGIDHIDEAAKEYRRRIEGCINIVDYLKNDISYPLDDNKKKGMETFLELLAKTVH